MSSRPGLLQRGDVLNRFLGAESSLTSSFGKPQLVERIRTRSMTEEYLERNRLFDFESWLPIIRSAVDL